MPLPPERCRSPMSKCSDIHTPLHAVVRDVLFQQRLDLRQRVLLGDAGNVVGARQRKDRKSTRLNSSHVAISYAVFCLKKKNVDGMNIISNDGSNKLNRSRKARVSYKVQRTINASLNAATSTREVSSNQNFVTRQKIEIIFS